MRLSPLEERKRQKLIILAYHRVADPNKTPLLNPRLVSAVPKDFDEQMEYLAANFNVISMETALESVIGTIALPKRAVLITFDDAYFDFPEFAWPILKKHRLPASVFVPTGFPAQPKGAFWWDQLHAAVMQTDAKQLATSRMGNLPLNDSKNRLLALRKLQKYVKTLVHQEAMDFVEEICRKLGNADDIQQSTMDWEQLRILSKQGLTLGAHTRTHPLLTQIPLDEAREEICGSYQDLKTEVGETLPIFAYPNGSYNDDIKHLLQEEGIVIAFAVLNKINNVISADPLALGRINITRKTSALLFKLRLYQWFCYLDGYRRRFSQ